MNEHVKVAAATPTSVSPEEWQARTDLAAVYRLCAHYGWDDVIYNHCSMRVPGEPSKFLMKQHELLWTEVTASNLRKVDMDADLDERAGVNRPGFTLHGGVLKARPDVDCAVHVHTETGMAISGLKHGLRMVSQSAIRFYNRVGYHVYEGITEDFGERARINAALGANRLDAQPLDPPRPPLRKRRIDHNRFLNAHARVRPFVIRPSAFGFNCRQRAAGHTTSCQRAAITPTRMRSLPCGCTWMVTRAGGLDGKISVNTAFIAGMSERSVRYTVTFATSPRLKPP